MEKYLKIQPLYLKQYVYRLRSSASGLKAMSNGFIKV